MKLCLIKKSCTHHLVTVFWRGRPLVILHLLHDWLAGEFRVTSGYDYPWGNSSKTNSPAHPSWCQSKTKTCLHVFPLPSVISHFLSILLLSNNGQYKQDITVNKIDVPLCQLKTFTCGQYDNTHRKIIQRTIISKVWITL